MKVHERSTEYYVDTRDIPSYQRKRKMLKIKTIYIIPATKFFTAYAEERSFLKMDADQSAPSVLTMEDGVSCLKKFITPNLYGGKDRLMIEQLLCR